MVKRFLVDDGPLNDLSEVFYSRPVSFPDGIFLVTEPTALDAKRYRPRQSFVDSAACRILKAPALGEVARILDRLRNLSSKKKSPTADLGEHYAIAWLLSHEAAADVAFVATDKGALALALLELGGAQVSHSFQLWLYLFNQGFLGYDDLEKLLEKTSKGDDSLPDRPWRMPPRPAA